jgi:succinyl-CoA synthetase beta subunit
MASGLRWLNLHEYQSKELLSSHGVRVQRGRVAETPEEAEACALELKNSNAQELILKAQILAGGRGKGTFNTGFKGGVKVVTNPLEIRDLASKMLGNMLITKQTGPEGQKVSKVLVHEGVSFDKELYLAFLLDRAYNGPVIVASPMGGVDIEEVAEKDPSQIHTFPIDIATGLTDEIAGKVAAALGIPTSDVEKSTDTKEQLKKLYKVFLETDATQIEINPLVFAKEDGKVYCVDAKFNFDENASFRHKDLFALRDTSMEDPREVEASKFHLNYVGLDGNIGCMVNGAGLAMATMDIIKLHGGEPANFLDVGGSATENQVAEAFRIICGDKNVKALLVNIFGGIMKCDVIA